MVSLFHDTLRRIGPFPSCCLSWFRSGSWCSTIEREMRLICIRIRNLFPFEGLRTRTRFETEACSNSEILSKARLQNIRIFALDECVFSSKRSGARAKTKSATEERRSHTLRACEARTRHRASVNSKTDCFAVYSRASFWNNFHVAASSVVALYHSIRPLIYPFFFGQT